MLKTIIERARSLVSRDDIDMPEARAEYLRQVCGDDCQLADRVVALLHAS